MEIGDYATTLRARHNPLIALLPAPAHWVAVILTARSFFRHGHENVFPFSETSAVVPAAGEEDRHEDQDDQDHQDNTGGKACPGWKLVDRVRPLCLGRTFNTRHAAVLAYDQVRNCALMSKPAGTGGAAKVSVLMTSCSIWLVLPRCGLSNSLVQSSAFPCCQREVRPDGADGVRLVASVFDGFARRGDLERTHERRNTP